MKGAMIASIITTIELFIIMALHATRSDSSRPESNPETPGEQPEQL